MSGVRLRHRRTAGGRPLALFEDKLGRTCALADSSISEDAIWLGLDGQPRMHLDRQMVAAILPLLAVFVERGTIRQEGDRR